MKQSDGFSAFFWLGLVFSLPWDVLKFTPLFERVHSCPWDFPQSRGSPGSPSLVPALCEPGALLAQGSWQGTVPTLPAPLQAARERQRGVMETLSPERKCEQNPALPEPLGFGGR